MSWWHQALDRSVVFSFDRTGFARHAQGFDRHDDAQRLDGQRYLVTGCNSGIGFAAVEQLAARGAQVLLACRSLERGRAAMAALKERAPAADLSLHQADMADLASVAELIEQVDGPLHGLVHNAGNMVDRCDFTAEQVEYITSLHVVGPHLLSLGLKEQLAAGAADRPARIIFVASGGMYTQGLNAAELFAPTGRYDGMRHYAHTKRAQVVLADQLHARLAPLGVGVHSMHPGWVDTPAIRRAMPKFTLLTQAILRTPLQGADTISWLAGAPDPSLDETSGFWFDRARAPLMMSKRVRVPEVEIKRMMARLDELVGSMV